MMRGSIWLGLVAILLGAFMFADAAGVRMPNGASPLEFFWPILLLLSGLALIIRSLFRRKVQVERASIALQGASRARVKLSHGAGKLKLHKGAARGELLSGTFTGGLRQSANRSDDKLDVKLRTASDLFGIPFLDSGERLDWDVSLNADVPLELELDSGANSAEIDLRDLQVTSLSLDCGASDTRLLLPARGRLHADVDVGAASMDVTIPPGVAARIRIDHGASDVKVDARFPRVGGVYKSPDFETAADTVDLDIDAGAATIRIH